MADTSLCRLTAVEAVALLKAGEVSPLELIDAAEARIEAVDGAVNATVTRCFDRARTRAAALDQRNAAHPGWLAGLPIGVKDLEDVEGVRTTFGCRIFKDNVSSRTDLTVQHLEAYGALVVSKTNTPEFGAGGQTFNEVFGVTRNPWDTRTTSSGSSGGSAVALATGQVWLATGSDLGGSLRTPASFCGVVGLRPSPGRIPTGPGMLPLNTLTLHGPMGRTVADVALMLDAEARHDIRDPLTYDAPSLAYSAQVAAPRPPRKVAWAGGFNGLCPIDPEIETICRAAALRFAELGAAVEEKAPDAAGARDSFQVFRGHNMAATHRVNLENHRDLLKPEVIWNIEYGLSLTADDVRSAAIRQGQLIQRFAAFFDEFDLICLPGAPVPPFAVELRYVEEINGQTMPSYIDWVLGSSIITMAGCPAVSVPCGFTRTGLPVGLQIVGKPRGEGPLLQAARLFEELAGLHKRLPIDPVVRH
jgi:amidase